MKRLLYIVTLLSLFGIWSCDKNPQPEEQKTPVINVTNKEVSLAATATSGTISYSLENPGTAKAVTVTSSASWISGFSATASQVSFSVQPNDGNERTATVTLAYSGAASVNVSVRQMAAGESIELDKSEINFTKDGGKEDVKVISARKWTLTGGADWVKASAASGDPNATISFTAEANPDAEPRSAEFTVTVGSNTATLKVDQAGDTDRMEFDKESISFDFSGGSVTVNAKAWNTWTLDMSESWVKADVAKGEAGQTAITFTAEEYSGTKADRQAKAVFTIGSATVELPVVQAHAPTMNDMFPDNTFRTFVRTSFDTDGDNYLSPSELAKVKSLVWDESVNGKIGTFKGIEYFSNLEEFRFSVPSYGEIQSAVTSIDLSKNKKLSSITVSDKKITDLDLSGLTEVEYLQLGSCSGITSIDVSAMAELEEMFLQNSGITSLDVSGCKELKQLSVSGTGITKLDLTNNTGLINLNAGAKGLKSLNMSTLTNLEVLSLDGSSIFNPDLGKLAQLREFNYSECPAATMDFSNNPLLESIRMSGCTSTTVDVHRNTKLNTLHLSDIMGSVFIHEIIFSTGQYIPDLQPDFMNRDDIYYDEVNKVKVTYVDADVPADIMTTISDATLKKYVVGHCDTDGDGKLTYSEAQAVTSVDITGRGITSLEGLEYFTNLETLKASGNMLKEVSFLNWQKLKEVDLSDNDIDCAINLVRSPLIETIDFSGNEITAVTNIPSTVIRIDLSDNELTELKCEYKSKLKYLDVSRNEITKASVHYDTALEYLDISDNKFADEGYNSAIRIWTLEALKTFKANNFGISDMLWYNGGDFPKLTSLETVWLNGVSDPQFTTLNLSASAASLKDIDIRNSSLTSLYIGDNATISDSAIKKDSKTVVYRSKP